MCRPVRELTKVCHGNLKARYQKGRVRTAVKEVNVNDGENADDDVKVSANVNKVFAHQIVRNGVMPLKLQAGLTENRQSNVRRVIKDNVKDSRVHVIAQKDSRSAEGRDERVLQTAQTNENQDDARQAEQIYHGCPNRI